MDPQPKQSISRTTPTHPEEGATASSRHLTMDGRKLKELIRAGYQWLRRQEEVVNSYNVYPVPDGDTGTNMMHTMRSAWEAVASLDDPNVGVVAKVASNGALRGSRGNSGIILSQLWRGFARSLDNKGICDAQDLVAAFKEAVRTAYSGVSTPVEGTILTVARELTEAVEHAARHTHDLRRLLEVAKDAAYESVQRTPNLLRILKEAGVVDSGGFGLYVILEGMWRMVNGMSVDEGEHAAVGLKAEAEAGLRRESGWGYDVQYLIYAFPGKPLDVAQIRADIEAMGECPIVTGDEEMVKVHVHVPDPGVPLSYGIKWGSLRDVVVEDMQAQSEAFVPQGLARATSTSVEPNLPEAEVGMVTVAVGEGMIRLFRDLGARAVIEGGQTMNPSVDDILGAINRAHARRVIVLPNNGNILMTAQQAAQLSSRPTYVVPTRTLPQGVAAAISFNPSSTVEENVEFMRQAASRVVTGEVTTATRDVTLNGVTVRSGQVIGLIDDVLCVAGETPEAVLLSLLAEADADTRELITLYYGNGLSQVEAERIAARVREIYPELQVDLVAGGQPHYFFVVGIE